TVLARSRPITVLIEATVPKLISCISTSLVLNCIASAKSLTVRASGRRTMVLVGSKGGAGDTSSTGGGVGGVKVDESIVGLSTGGGFVATVVTWGRYRSTTRPAVSSSIVLM